MPANASMKMLKIHSLAIVFFILIIPMLLGKATYETYIRLLFAMPKTMFDFMIFLLLVLLSISEVIIGYLVVSGKILKSSSEKIKELIRYNTYTAPLLYALIVEILTITSIINVGQLALFLIIAAIGYFVSIIEFE
ncbi:MAG: hypothetical protein ACTSSP_07930 [Candidatus Asgardarchaeia archaeon]